MNEAGMILFWLFIILVCCISGVVLLKDLMYFGVCPTKAQRLKRASAVIFYIAYAIFSIFLFYYGTLNNFSFKNQSYQIIMALAYIPILIGGILIVPYRFIIAPLYIFISKKYYPEVISHKFFPDYYIPGTMNLGASLFLFVRGFRLPNASLFYLAFSEICRLYVVFLFLALGWFCGTILVYLLNWFSLRFFNWGMHL